MPAGPLSPGDDDEPVRFPREVVAITGGDGLVVMVLLHGVLMGGSLWDTVVEGLGDRYRCIVPELPFGAHTTPMPDDADLSLPALATLIAEFLTELDLRQATLVCNDPLPFGALSKRRVPDDLFRSWLGPLRHNRKVRRDLPPQRPQTPAAARVGRPAAHLRRPGPHRLGTRRQAHAPPPTPNDSPTTSRTPNSCRSTTAEPSSLSTNRRS